MDFFQISILLVAAAAFGVVARLLKQPLLIGYLFAGLVLTLFGVIPEGHSLAGLGQIGVALLLFLLGLEMNLGELPEIGRVALITGIGQIVFTSGFGFVIARILGFGLLPSVYIAVGLTFSSTIIMVKLLSEKKDLSSLYGKIAVGFLLVQDFVAVIILMFLASVGQGGQSAGDYVVIAAKAVVLLGLVWGLSKRVLPQIFDKFIAPNAELLFIVSIAWALGVASLVAGPVGFTLEIGGFLAGLSLSNLGEHLQIASKTRSLRDFFLTIFFIYLGTQLVVPGGLWSILPAGIIFSLFVLVGNPIIVLVILGLLGYKKRTSFMAGLTVAQISEFSLILMSMGLSLGHVSEHDVALVVFVGVVTMTVSTYMIIYAEVLYRKLSRYLGVFERTKTRETAINKEKDFDSHIVLIGSDRTGRALSNFLRNSKADLLIVDFNPRVYTKMTAEGFDVLFGDIADAEIMAAAGLDKAKLVISTTSNLEDNLILLEYMASLKNKPISIFTSQLKSEAIKLYERGASYVIVPEVAAGEHIRHLLRTYGTKSERLVKMGKSHFNRLMFV